tara:strand:+ start:6737 stop:6970 length:234 start_codon:yes stop_codon:yes gene_type:complete
MRLGIRQTMYYLYTIGTLNKYKMTNHQGKYYCVRYAGKEITIIFAYSKWEAIDRIFNENIERYDWIRRELLTAKTIL